MSLPFGRAPGLSASSGSAAAGSAGKAVNEGTPPSVLPAACKKSVKSKSKVKQIEQQVQLIVSRSDRGRAGKTVCLKRGSSTDIEKGVVAHLKVVGW